MKKMLTLAFILVLLTACNLPIGPGAEYPANEPAHHPNRSTAAPATAEPAPVTAEPPASPAPTTPPGTELNLRGVYMVIPPCLNATVSGEMVAAQPYDPNGGPMQVFPEHRRVNFTTYPLANTFFEAHIRVFPMAEYAGMYENAANQLVSLQNTLASKPAEVEGSLPFLPGFNAGQVFHVKMAYLNFANGQGIRYLTEYAQYSAPFNNHDLFYTFQGLSADGTYWISAVLPIDNAILQENYESTIVPPGTLPMPDFMSPSFEAELNAYYAGMKAIVNSTADDTFNPAITCLDQFIQSINIGE